MLLTILERDGWDYEVSKRGTSTATRFVRRWSNGSREGNSPEDEIAVCEGYDRPMNTCLAALKARGIDLIPKVRHM